MLEALKDPRLLRILKLPEANEADWHSDLDRFQRDDLTLTRESVGESSIKAVQRLLIFLGYSTASTGAFLIDGDFGRGTNRAVAQFQFEHGLTPDISRSTLCYACTWQSARANIVEIPDARLTPATLSRMVDVALGMIDRGTVMCGDLDEAVFHIDALHRRRLLSCKEILARYSAFVQDALATISAERNIDVVPEWLLAIIKQETSGIVRPRFEQHLLTRINAKSPSADFIELRHRSMSMGLGQILGDNFRKVGAASARDMYTSSLSEQVAHIARFVVARPQVAAVVGQTSPSEEDFRTVARYYNGPGYEKHHYHESLASWFREFRALRA